ncbi:MAG: cytidylate kinase-like family protein [Deltaproteobacteria bacterium]|nr:cytidylate kinase-like family protein [Deltaproteobacteria bacterium]
MRTKVLRSEDALVEEQLGKWRLPASEPAKEVGAVKPQPVITISRETGCGATQIAQKLADTLKMDLMGSKIIQMVAESTEMSEKVVKSLDEKEISKRDEWLSALFDRHNLWPDQYLQHLTKVIGTIGRHGNAVILGRGANFILPHEETFSVRIIAPWEMRIENSLKTTREEAQRYLANTDSSREAFIRKYFNADVTNPAYFDLVLNMRGFSIDSAVKTIIGAFNSWKS